jgi:hypothetical protein
MREFAAIEISPKRGMTCRIFGHVRVLKGVVGGTEFEIAFFGGSFLGRCGIVPGYGNEF